jgi:hypothetical protein
MSGPIGSDAAALARRTHAYRAVQMTRDAARRLHALGDPTGSSAHVVALAATVEDVLRIHEPRDGTRRCPACSAGGVSSIWPCRTWREVAQRLVLMAEAADGA